MRIDEAIEGISREKLRAVQELQLFDSSLWLGRPQHFPLAEELSLTLLGDTAKQYFIGDALVSHWDGLTLSPQDGNRALADAEASLPGEMSLIWTGLPLLPREQGPLPGLGKPVSRLKAVRLFPKSHHFSLSPWVVGELCQWCIAHELPLFLWHVEIEWEAVYALARQFPRLHVVIESQWQKILYHNRNLYNLLRDNPNVFLETSNFVGQDFVTHAVKTFGAERLLFGSFLPVNDAWTSIGMIVDADISEQEKRLIAGENLRSILRGESP